MEYRSLEIDHLFSEKMTIGHYITIEKALAEVQAALGMIPRAASNIIQASIKVSDIDLNDYRHDFEKIGFPIVGLIKQLNLLVPEGCGAYLHWGATTQDIMDTGLVLTLKESINLFQKEIDSLIAFLTKMSKKHQTTLMVGRSQLQQAIPISFGYKVATWLAPLIRHKERLNNIKERLLYIQFGGAVGTLASLEGKGELVREKLAEKLDLKNPILSWHTQRDSIAEFMSFIGMLTSSLSKIAQDILLMTQSEIGEVTEIGEGKSSTMPNKRNPILTQNVLIAGKLTRSSVPTIIESMVQDHERGSAMWQMEWSLIPEITSHGFFTLQALNKVCRNIEVNTSNMLKNVNQSGALIYAEAIMMKLARSFGRQKAHDILDDVVSQTLKGASFIEVLQQTSEIKQTLSEEELINIFSGKTHVKIAGNITENFLKSI